MKRHRMYWQVWLWRNIHHHHESNFSLTSPYIILKEHIHIMHCLKDYIFSPVLPNWTVTTHSPISGCALFIQYCAFEIQAWNLRLLGNSSKVIRICLHKIYINLNFGVDLHLHFLLWHSRWASLGFSGIFIQTLIIPRLPWFLKDCCHQTMPCHTLT